MIDPTQRFSDRVDNYVKYRPDYPMAMLAALSESIGFSADWQVADIGSGTGKSTLPFLVNGNHCFGIEPNDAMRLAAEKILGDYPKFHSIAATAEATQMDDRSIDLVVAGQAFHWFDIAASKKEFQRILKKEGYCLLLWNKRLDDRSPFMEAYNDFLLEFSTDYQKVNLRRVDHEVYHDFFRAGAYKEVQLPHHQVFTLAGLVGRYLSSSYAFSAGHQRHKEAMSALNTLFNQHEKENQVLFLYNTGLYIGKV